MSDQQILEQAIKKAIDGGWEYIAWYLDRGKYLVNVGINIDVTLERLASERYANSYIFNHEFAKALWPEQTGTHHVNGVYGEQPIYSWQDHLRDMVTADDPIKYLGDHLE